MSKLDVILDELWSVCESAVDLQAWWSEVRAAADVVLSRSGELLAALKLDQRYRWQTSEPWLVEDYVHRLPNLPIDIDWRFELAVGEFEARRLSRCPLSDEEFSSRFPDLIDTLRQRLGGTLAVEQASANGDMRTVVVKALADGGPGGALRTATWITTRGIEASESGRYRLDRIVGEGAFGQVYLGYDVELRRQVAVKVPKATRFRSPRDAEQYLQEARLAAGLQHPQIVPVYDVGRTADGSIYVVSRFIDGGTLADRLQQGRVEFRESAEWLISVAEALQHAHSKHLIHRDVKPANILIDQRSGTAFLADFGLTIGEDEYLSRTELAGTPAYMSPEQALGEGHRLDARSDVFALGVVLYECLTNVRPFSGETRDDLLQAIVSRDPCLPTSLQPSVPQELQRICLKALAKRASDRYSTAAAFAEDLQAWLRPVTIQVACPSSTKIRPRGLRSFDHQDADYFPELLPGLRNREGLPDSIAFWMQRIGESTGDDAFSVGLLYGPSGCGKSSLVKAGLIPRLPKHIVTVYVEATAMETELRVCSAVQRHFSNLPSNGVLADLMSSIRRNPGPKVVIFIDQFEQWLNGKEVTADSDLVRALRQCDGIRLQAVVMIRDDFFVSASRLMQQLDIPIVQQHNCVMLDLFDVPHATAVLRKFGVAYGRLPAGSEETTVSQRAFIEDAVQGLAEGQKVISVRLSLFAEMVRSMPWEPATLIDLGGTAGVGVKFLEETFSSPRSDVRYRQHESAIRGVLKALIPVINTDIKGSVQTVELLQSAAGYTARGRDFEELLRILDNELRLITPADTEWADAELSGSSLIARRYQLTHDYLVPALREWLTRRQKETAAGRATLLLEERTSVWQIRPEDRQLPSLREYLQIRCHLPSASWSTPQRQLMSKTGRRYGIRCVLLSVFCVLVTITALLVQRRVDTERESLRISGDRKRASDLVHSFVQRKTSELEGGLDALRPLKTHAVPELRKLYREASGSPEARLHLCVATLHLDDNAVSLLPETINLALDCRPEQLFPLSVMLRPWSTRLLPDLQTVLRDVREQSRRRVHAACLLATWETGSGGNEAWSQNETADFVVGVLVKTNPVYVELYEPLLHPQASRWIPEVVRRLLERDPEPDLIRATLPLLTANRELAVPEFEAVLEEKVVVWPDPPLDPSWQKPAADVERQFTEAAGVISERFAYCMDMPLSRLITLTETLRVSGFRPTRLRPHAGVPSDEPRMSAVWVRDGRRWQVKWGLKQESLPAPDIKAEKDGLLLDDLAYVSGQSPHAGWLTLWSEPKVPGEERFCITGLTEEQWYKHLAESKHTQLTLQVYHQPSTAHDRWLCGIFSNQKLDQNVVQLTPDPWGPSGLGAVLDISSGFSRKLVLHDPLDRYRSVIAEMLNAPVENQAHPDARLSLAEALYHTDQFDRAIELINGLQDDFGHDPWVSCLRCLTLAQLGHHAEAVMAYEQRQQTLREHGIDHSIEDPYADYINILLLALSNDTFGLRVAVSEAILRCRREFGAMRRYNLARALALVARQHQKAGRPTEAKRLREQALTLLEQVQQNEKAAPRQNGYYPLSFDRSTGTAGFLMDPDLIDLHTDPRFSAIAHSVYAEERCAYLPGGREGLHSQVFRESSLDMLAEAVRSALESQYRPVGAIVDLSSEPNIVMLLLHHPSVPVGFENSRSQKITALTMLLRLNAPERVLPVLSDSSDDSDPALRDEILSRLPVVDMNANTLFAWLRSETDAGRRQAWIQGIGELAKAELIPKSEFADVIAKLQLLYNDVDPGVHSVAEWALRQLGAENQVEASRKAASTGMPQQNRRWYVARSLELSLTIVEDRFAISAHAITRSQYARSLPEAGDGNNTVSDELAQVTWFDAARFCNWLSEQEGIPRDQWCYDPDQKFISGMKLRPNLLELSGYRLPTEKEYRSAVRDAEATEYFWKDRELLEAGRSPVVVDSGGGNLDYFLKPPNRLGLFNPIDNGNVNEDEWCHDRYSTDENDESESSVEDGLRVVLDVDGIGGSLASGSFHRFRVSRALVLQPPPVVK